MEINTQIKSFLLLLLTPCLAFFICQLPSFLTTFKPWQQILPAPPANSVMIVGVSEDMPSFPTFVKTKDGKYYRYVVSSKNKQWILVNDVSKKAKNNLLAKQYKLSNPLIPFLFNRPLGTVIDHFVTEHLFIESGWPRYKVYYVLLDGGTLWSWSDPLSLDYHRFFNRVGVIYAVIVFGVTGVMLLRKRNQLLRLIYPSLAIGLILTMFLLFFYSSFGFHVYFDIFSEKSSEIFLS